MRGGATRSGVVPTSSGQLWAAIEAAPAESAPRSCVWLAQVRPYVASVDSVREGYCVGVRPRPRLATTASSVGEAAGTRRCAGSRQGTIRAPLDGRASPAWARPTQRAVASSPLSPDTNEPNIRRRLRMMSAQTGIQQWRESVTDLGAQSRNRGRVRRHQRRPDKQARAEHTVRVEATTPARPTPVRLTATYGESRIPLRRRTPALRGRSAPRVPANAAAPDRARAVARWPARREPAGKPDRKPALGVPSEWPTAASAKLPAATHSVSPPLGRALCVRTRAPQPPECSARRAASHLPARVAGHVNRGRSWSRSIP